MNQVKELMQLERLAVRKAEVYGRVLTDVSLAGEMQALAKFHGERESALAQILGMDGKLDKVGDENEA